MSRRKTSRVIGTVATWQRSVSWEWSSNTKRSYLDLGSVLSRNFQGESTSSGRRAQSNLIGITMRGREENAFSHHG